MKHVYTVDIASGLSTMATMNSQAIVYTKSPRVNSIFRINKESYL
jgi:hypothetical protein